MAGGTGNDWYIVDSLTDVIIEAAGQGTLDRVFTSVNYTLTAGAHVEILSTTIFTRRHQPHWERACQHHLRQRQRQTCCAERPVTTCWRAWAASIHSTAAPMRTPCLAAMTTTLSMAAPATIGSRRHRRRHHQWRRRQRPPSWRSRRRQSQRRLWATTGWRAERDRTTWPVAWATTPTSSPAPPTPSPKARAKAPRPRLHQRQLRAGGGRPGRVPGDHEHCRHRRTQPHRQRVRQRHLRQQRRQRHLRQGWQRHAERPRRPRHLCVRHRPQHRHQF